MLDQCATFDPQRERATIRLALASLLRLEAMQLAVMPGERADADQPPIVRKLAPPRRYGQDQASIQWAFTLRQLLTRFLNPSCSRRSFVA